MFAPVRPPFEISHLEPPFFCPILGSKGVSSKWGAEQGRQPVARLDHFPDANDNDHTMRRLIAATGVVSFALAFVQMPLLHLHKTARHEHAPVGAHEHGAVIHAHFDNPAMVGQFHRDAPSIAFVEDHETEEVRVAFGIKNEASRPLVVQMQYWGTICPPDAGTLWKGVSAPRSHDPPQLEPLEPRGPPA